MENSTVIKLLNVLSENEIRLINRKLKTERNELILSLFNYLIKNINKPNKLTKENVYKAVFTNSGNYNDQKFTRLRFQLFHFIENEILFNFLTTEDQSTISLSNFFKARLLHNFYTTKNSTVNSINNTSLSALKHRKLSEMEQFIENVPNKSELYFLNKYLISAELYFGIQNQNNSHLKIALKNLDIFYCLAKMRIGAEIGQHNLTNATIKNEVFENALNFSQNLEYKNVPLIKIYQAIGSLHQKVELKKLKLLKKLIFESANLLSKQDLGNVIGILNNFTITGSGQLEQTNELFYLKYQVIKFGFDNGVFIADGFVRPNMILNFAFICFELKKIAALKKTLNIHCLLLEEKHKYKVMKLCEAYINILEKNFMPAFNILDNNSFLPYNLLAKVLRLRCVYELEISKVSYFDGSLYDESLVFKRYLNRQLNNKKINQNTYESFMTLANFLLDAINPAYTKEELLELLNSKYTDVRYKNWCIEKVENLS